MANVTPARERGLSFPGGMQGLHYWSVAGLDSDTTSIRAALKSVFEGEAIGKWLDENPSDEELRARLLRRVRWALSAPDLEGLAELVRYRIAELLRVKGLLVSSSDEIIRGLLDRVFEAASKSNPLLRQLTELELHRAVEDAASATATLQQVVRAISGNPASAEDVLVNRLESYSPHNIINRQDTIAEIRNRVVGEPVIWLHGAHGLGKSTLAKLIARDIGGLWLHLDLRPVQEDKRGSLAAWRALIRATIEEPEFVGIIVDDFAGPAADALQSRLAALAFSIKARGIRIFLTSWYAPSAARLADLGASSRAAVLVPYFTEDEVRDLVTSGDRPPEKLIDGWTRLIRLTTNGGHPLLVAAKIASLRSRSWPSSALLEDFGHHPNPAIQTTRDEARRLLLDELPSDGARQLLRRLGNVFDRADSALAIKLANQQPIIPNAGDILSVLRGPWIEMLPPNDLRLSPLISDIGSDVRAEEAERWRRVAAEHWLGQGVLNERTLPLCFWNAFWGKHGWVLAKLCETIQTLPEDSLRGAAALLSPMTMLVTNRSIFPESKPIASMLRLLQFEVANLLEDDDVAGKAAARLLIEIDAIEHEELRLLETYLAVPKILLADHANTSANFQVECVLRLRSAQRRIDEIDSKELKQIAHNLAKNIDPSVDLPGVLFALVVNRIRTSARMLELIQTLNSLDANDRDYLLQAAAVALGTAVGSFIHNGWAQEQLEGVNLNPTLERFAHITKIVRSWQREDVLAQTVVAQCVILDEGLGDAARALALIDVFIRELTSSPILIRQKAKMLGHKGEHAAAARLLMSVEEVVGAGDRFDRGLALRDGAVSAAHAEMYPDAIRLFSKARNEFSLCDRRALATGAQIDIAVTNWAANNRQDALRALADALEETERLDSAASRQDERVHQFARAVIGLFFHDLEPSPREKRPDIPIGNASALVGDEPPANVDLKPLADNWRILALCEQELGIDLGIDERSKPKQSGSVLASIEVLIAHARYSRAIGQNDAEQAFRIGAQAVSAQKVLAELRAQGEKEPRATWAELESKSIEGLVAEGWRDVVRTIPLDLLIWHRFGGGWDPHVIVGLEGACARAWGDARQIADIINAALGKAGTEKSSALELAGRLSPQFDPTGNPPARFIRDQLLVCHLAVSAARRLLEPLVLVEVAEGWSRVIQDETFALRMPLRHVPQIQSSIAGIASSGLRGAARLLLTAAPAVGVQLAEDWTRFLTRIVEG